MFAYMCIGSLISLWDLLGSAAVNAEKENTRAMSFELPSNISIMVLYTMSVFAQDNRTRK
mgnify:FL=1